MYTIRCRLSGLEWFGVLNTLIRWRIPIQPQVTQITRYSPDLNHVHISHDNIRAVDRLIAKNSGRLGSEKNFIYIYLPFPFFFWSTVSDYTTWVEITPASSTSDLARDRLQSLTTSTWRCWSSCTPSWLVRNITTTLKNTLHIFLWNDCWKCVHFCTPAFPPWRHWC